MKNELKNYEERTFEDIKHIDENGNEYWEARELMVALEYSKWENFKKVVEKAIIACKNSNNKIEDHFTDIRKKVETGDSLRYIQDYKLSRYACYLIVQNSDSRKKSIALGQTYFAIQTRRMELTEEEYGKLSEDDKRLYRRKQTKDGNKVLYKIAKEKVLKTLINLLMLAIKDYITVKQQTI